jgi:two-component system, chemotaxis family, sensor kinase CheA
MDFDANQYIDLFFQDTEEHLEILNDALLELENNPENKEAISELFRVAHTLKSSSAMVGFDHISTYTHKLEDCLSKIRDGEVSPEPGIIDSLFKCFDILKEMLGNLQSGETEAKKNQLKKAANHSLESLSRQVSGEEEAPVVEKKGGRPPVVELAESDRVKIQDYQLAGEKIYEVIVHLDPGTRMGSVRAYLVCTNLRQIGDVIRVCPDVENDENAEVGETFTLILATHVDEDEILAKTNVDEVKEAIIRDVTDTDMYDVVKTPEEMKPGEGPGGEAETPAGEAPKGESAGGATTAFDRREDRTATRTVRVSIEKLDILLNLAGELVINRGRAMQQASLMADMTHHSLESEDMIESIQEQGRLINQLQEAVMDTRMVPIGQVFSRFRRVVRDLSKEKGKKINLDINGEETELDKKIIDQIGDPLTHMVRNAVDHGIEEPQERKKTGKPAEGTLRFDAYHEGNNIHVKVSDDGRGIDVERIREKALEKGLASAEALEQMSERDVLQLIFQPGFSTAKQVTDISGRGVGMDVVKRAIDELGGHVEINTKLGQGTVFIIKLPLTLAIIQALLVDVGGEIFAIPIANVKETIRITRKEIFSVEGKAEVIRLRDQVVPLLRLDEILETPSMTQNERLYVAVIGYEDKQVGLVVDRMVNEQEVVVKALEGEVKKVDCIAGASIMGDGSVSLILDGVALIDYGLKMVNGATAKSGSKEKVGA